MSVSIPIPDLRFVIPLHYPGMLLLLSVFTVALVALVYSRVRG